MPGRTSKEVKRKVMECWYQAYSPSVGMHLLSGNVPSPSPSPPIAASLSATACSYSLAATMAGLSPAKAASSTVRLGSNGGSCRTGGER